MPISEISDLLTTRRGPRVPRDYLQGYLEYARTVSEGAGDSGRSLLDRMVTEKSAERDLGNHKVNGFTKSVENFMEARDGRRQRHPMAEHADNYLTLNEHEVAIVPYRWMGTA